MNRIRARFCLPVFLILLSSSLAFAESVTATVKSIMGDYGNLNTSVTASQLHDLGISQGENYTMQHKGTKVTVYYGMTYSDVATGEWVSFVLDDGTIQIARNFENAAETLKVSVDDEIIISNLN